MALGRHVLWMLDFLHAHHSSEDAGLWPLVRRRNPAAAELLDSMEADHARIAPAADVVDAAARDYTTTTTDSARVALVVALDGLLDVLVPHLDREVAEAMPVVAASITNREWDAVEIRERHVGGQAQLGRVAEIGNVVRALLAASDLAGSGVAVHDGHVDVHEDGVKVLFLEQA